MTQKNNTRARATLASVAAGLALSFAAHAAAILPAAPTASDADYQRAARVSNAPRNGLVLNNGVKHTWLDDSARLWYRHMSTDGGSSFVLVDVAHAAQTPAFDHAKMATALGKSLGRTLDPAHLPIDSLLFETGKPTPNVRSGGQIYACDLTQLLCKVTAPKPTEPGLLMSPNGKYGVFVRGDDLWMKDVASGDERRLSSDGQPTNRYARQPEWNGAYVKTQMKHLVLPPDGVFSPDGRKFLTYRIDLSRLKTIPMVQSVPEDGSFRPMLYQFHYPLPGDPEPMAEICAFDLESGQPIAIDRHLTTVLLVGPVGPGRLFWGASNDVFYVLDNSHDFRTLSVSEVSTRTGKSRTLVSEDSDHFYWSSSLVLDGRIMQILANGDVLWASSRTGFTSLFLYDGKTGKLKNAVTPGDLVVRQVVRIDEAAHEIYFIGVGDKKNSDPYYRALYRVRLDGTKLKRLTPEDADHNIDLAPQTSPLPPGIIPVRPPETAGFAPNGAWFVDNYSTLTQPTRAVVRDRNGKQVMVLETASLAPDFAQHYTPPEAFHALAADGKTVIYGTLFKPANFDPTQRYPVIDAIYPGPLMLRVGKGYLSDTGSQAMAELGFIVLTLDGRGMPLRSRQFEAYAWGNMKAAGALEDHVAVTKELARERPYMDIDRVGMSGGSGGGFATARALCDYPDFYKVGVSLAGNHDPRSYDAFWTALADGPYDPKSYAEIPSYHNVANFKGKLLLIHGELDDNVHPANTLRVVDELIKHNKRFDLLIVPNVDHWSLGSVGYVTNRVWDYFVSDLQGGTPPPEMVLGTPPGAGH